MAFRRKRMPGYENFDRQYRLIAGQAGAKGFEVGGGRNPLHISFSMEKSDLESQNTGKIEIWNLNDSHIAELEKKNCVVALNAGYGAHRPLIFTGIVSFVSTVEDGADRKTSIEVIDNLIQARDTYVSVSYSGQVSWKTIFDDVATKMGIPISYSHNVSFAKITNGFSFVGLAKNILTKGCQCCGLSWSIQNGVLQVKRPRDVMSLEVFEISAKTGMIGSPEKVTITSGENSNQNRIGWDVRYFLNGAINVNDYVKLVSKKITGYFYVYSQEIAGDNVSGDWMCKSRLLELERQR